MRVSWIVAALVGVVSWSADGVRADWKAPVAVAQTTDDSNWPQFVIDSGDTLHVVWHEGPFLGDTEIYYSSRPAGGTWSAPVSVSNRPDEASSYPDVAVGPDGTLHVVWDDGKFSDREIYYASLPPGGSWSTPVNLSNTAVTQSFFPHVEVGASGDVYVVWEEALGIGPSDEIYFAEKPAGGSWSAATNISDGPGDAHDPFLLVDGDHLYLAYWEPPGIAYQFFFMERPAGGSWSTPQQVTVSSDDSQDIRLVLGSDDTLHAVWNEGSDVAYASRPSGGSWSAPESATGDAFGRNAALLVDPDGTVHVAYEFTSFQSEAYYSRRDPGGSWSTPENLSNTPNNASENQVSLARLDGDLYFYFVSVFVQGTFGSELYETRLGPGGWSSPRRLTARRYTNGFSIEPPQIDGNGTLHHVYFACFAGDGLFDVYHLRNDGPGPTPPVMEGFVPDGGSGSLGVPVDLAGVYSDANGGGSMQRNFLVLNTQLSPVGGLGLAFDWVLDLFVLLNDVGGVSGTCAAGESTVLDNGYARLDCAASRVDHVGEDERTVTWQVTFDQCPPNGCGALDAAVLAIDTDGLRGGPAVVGSWTLDP